MVLLLFPLLVLWVEIWTIKLVCLVKINFKGSQFYILTNSSIYDKCDEPHSPDLEIGSLCCYSYCCCRCTTTPLKTFRGT